MVSRRVYWARWAYFVFAALIPLAVLLLVFTVGLSLFVSPGNWAMHKNWGHLPEAMILILPVLALLGRLPRALTPWLVATLVLIIVQTLLPTFRGSVPMLAALHPVNAFILFVVSGMHTRKAWQLARSSQRETDTAPQKEVIA